MEIKGISVILFEKNQIGENEFKEPIFEETPVVVDNVLVAPTASQGMPNDTELSLYKTTYTLAIPKGDTHTWTNSKVHFFGADWRTVGEPIQGIDGLMPLEWNKKIGVERYE